jgi:hypothetical protein
LSCISITFLERFEIRPLCDAMMNCSEVVQIWPLAQQLIRARCHLWCVRDVVCVCSGWFYVYDFILYGRNFVNIFVVLGRFKISKE